MQSEVEKKEILNRIDEYLEKIMDYSYGFCKHEDTNISYMSVKINESAFEAKKWLDRLQ